MRRRNKKKTIKFLLIFFAFFLFASSSYAYLSTRVSIVGVARGSYSTNAYTIDPSGNPNLSIQDFSLNRWQEGSLNKYHYTFKLKNNGTVNIDNYKITVNFNGKIESVSIWNNSYTIDNKTLIITNDSVNITPGGNIEIGFIASSYLTNLSLLKFKLETSTETHEIDPSKFLVEFIKTNGWGNYTYQYNVSLTNKTGTTVNYWELNVTLPAGTSYLSGWNAKFSMVGNILNIKNESYNGKIANNGNISFGIQLNTNIENYVPKDIKIIIR